MCVCLRVCSPHCVSKCMCVCVCVCGYVFLSVFLSVCVCMRERSDLTDVSLKHFPESYTPFLSAYMLQPSPLLNATVSNIHVSRIGSWSHSKLATSIVHLKRIMDN